MSDELSATENRIVGGCDHLIQSGQAWFGAGEYAGRDRVKAILGRAVGATCAGWFVGGVAYVVGPWAWGSAGVVLALSVWVAGGEHPEDDGTGDMDPAVFLELVHDVSGGGNVHLVTVREQLLEETGREWSGPAATALCRAAGIPVRDGVRVPGASPAVTTGIHRADLPPLPHPDREGAVDGEEAGQNTNNNTNSGDLTRTEVGQAAVIVKRGPSIRQEIGR